MAAKDPNRPQIAMKRDRHAEKCRVCNHPETTEIERLYVNWAPPKIIAELYDLPEWSLSRHKDARGLGERRLQNVIGGLTEIALAGIAKATSGEATAAHGLDALKAIARISGQWIDRVQEVPLEAEGRTAAELLSFAETGYWPEDAPARPQ